uniref:PDZ domain-containing protein n=1 Tax=Panagrellus redivivus TaxID=6233 RepID=A0A7E4VG01_PANRE
MPSRSDAIGGFNANVFPARPAAIDANNQPAAPIGRVDTSLDVRHIRPLNSPLCRSLSPPQPVAMFTSSSAYGHEAGKPLECLSIAVVLEKEQVLDATGNLVYRVGFKVGGGIDQDPSKAPYAYPDLGVYITQIDPHSPAEKAGLRQHDKILQVNDHDFTMLTHEKAVRYIKKYPVLHMLIVRREMATF